jgi:hypothetical protein
MTRRPSAFSAAKRTTRAGAASHDGNRRRNRKESGFMDILDLLGRGNEGLPDRFGLLNQYFGAVADILSS